MFLSIKTNYSELPVVLRNKNLCISFGFQEVLENLKFNESAS